MREISACKKHGKHCGIGGLASRPELMNRYIAEGARYVSLDNDLSLLLNAATAKAAKARESFAVTPAP